jgi:ABC-type Zn uptake system ZnuABC Zn-binding protein ZnuA
MTRILHKRKRLSALWGVIALASVTLLGGCGQSSIAKNVEHDLGEKPIVMATTTQLEDIVRTVGGMRVQVIGLVSRNGDPHAFEPTPEDARHVAQADAVFKNGLHLEGWIDELIENAGGASTRLVVDVSRGVKVAPIAGAFAARSQVDPHVWMNPLNMIRVTDNIVSGLQRIDPDGAAVFRARGERYKAQLRELDAWTKRRLRTIPAARRKLVTAHDAMGYFAARYGFTVVGAVIPDADTEAETSAKQLSDLVKKICAAKVPAIFAEASNNPKWVEQVGREASVKVVKDLRVDSLGAIGTPSGTYIGFFRSNVEKIASALQ